MVEDRALFRLSIDGKFHKLLWQAGGHNIAGLPLAMSVEGAAGGRRLAFRVKTLKARIQSKTA